MLVKIGSKCLTNALTGLLFNGRLHDSILTSKFILFGKSYLILFNVGCKSKAVYG